MPKITNVITLQRYADKHGLCPKRLRRLARNDNWPIGSPDDPTPFKFGSVWAIDANAPKITLPDKSTRGARRPDGRQRYVVYVNSDELTAIAHIVTAVNIIDPRVAARERRELRKLAIAQSEHDAAELADAATENDVNG